MKDKTQRPSGEPSAATSDAENQGMDLVAFLGTVSSMSLDDLTEADTRAILIDPILERLGWASGAIKREPYAGWSDTRGYIDYLVRVDTRPTYVIEAKRVGRTFSLPNALKRQRTTSLRKLMSTAGNDLIEAIDQCVRYCQRTGAPYACATNGLEWVFFKPFHPYRDQGDARAVLFSGIDDVLKHLNAFDDLLSPNGVEQGRTEATLLGREIQVPSFAKRLSDAYPYRANPNLEEEEYSFLLDQILRHYVVDLTTDDDFDKCYVPMSGNRRTAGSLDALIANQVSALRNTGSSPADFGPLLVSQKGLPNILSGRTVVLHGAIGVGKTSFLRSAELSLKKSKKLEQAVWAKVDLLPFSDRPFEIENVNSMLHLLCNRVQASVAEATQALGGRYDTQKWSHLRDIYNQEVRQFQKGRFPDSDDSDQDYIAQARQFVWDLSQKDPQDHLVRVIRWLTWNCRLPVVLVLDNSDQLGLEFQEFLYKLSETFQRSTCAVTILVLRTEALLSHRIMEHALATVGEQYQVEKAPLPVVLKRRFEVIESTILSSADEAPQAKVARERLSVLMETLEHEASVGSDAFRLIDGAGNGNLRESLRAVAAVFRASPKLMDRLVADQARHGRARLRANNAIRALLKEDLTGGEPKLMPNVFLVESQVVVPYSLGVRVLQQVKSKAALAEYTVALVLNDFSIAGVDRGVVARVLTRLRRNRFLSIAHIHQEMREVDVLRVTPLGDVLLDIVLGLRNYYDQMVFDTHIYDPDVYHDLRSTWNSNAEWGLKLQTMGRRFAKAVADDDEAFRRRLTLSVMEPVISAQISGVVAVAAGEAEHNAVTAVPNPR